MPEHYLFGQRKSGDLSPDDARTIAAMARRHAESLQQVPLTEILTVLDRMARAWADPHYGPRQQALAKLPDLTGFSPEMVAAELDAIPMALSRAYLEPKIRGELGSLDCLDAWRKRPGHDGLTRAFPRGVVLHVSSGNVSVGGSLSAVEGLVTRNVNLIKAASDDPFFPILFAESLHEMDPDGIISNGLAVLSWSGRQVPLHRVFQQECDAIVVWGGEEVVQEYRRDLPLRCRLIEYGPRISFAVVGQELATVPATAEKLAQDIGLWDQTACSSAQTVYVEDPTENRLLARQFAAALAVSLEAFQRQYPMGRLDDSEKAEITKERQMAFAEMAMGQATLITPAKGQHWTIVEEADPTFKLSPLFRTVTVKAVPDLAQVADLVNAYGPLLQTCGLGVAPERAETVAGSLARVGVLRFTALGEMTGGFAGEPHDGVYALGELVKWVSLHVPGLAGRMEPSEWWAPETLQRHVWAKARHLAESVALQAPLYRERFGGRQIRSYDDWQALPILERADLYAHTPPNGDGLLCRPVTNGHVLRSGGSAGTPKISIFSFEDYETDMRFAAAGAVAAGMQPGDRVANLFMAGRLYGSYLSMNRMLEIIGCVSFPLLTTAPIDEVVDCIAMYGIDTVIGTPSHLALVFDTAIKRGLRLQKAFYTGEQLYPNDKAYYMDKLGLEVFASIGYGTVDGGPLGYQCGDCLGSVHHIHSDHQFIEIVDPATGRPVPEGEPGDLLVTNLNRTVMPLIRFRMGDTARWVPGLCACGRTTPRLELLGRSDDMLIVANSNVEYTQILTALSAVPALSSSLQMVADREDRRDALIIRVEARPEGAGGDLNALANAAREAVVAGLPVLASALKDGSLATLAVEVLLTGSLERNERTGKLIRLVDRRIQP
jgi:phenylacetate-coenzyme A ligase PaaK-like adenylate-forming protein